MKKLILALSMILALLILTFLSFSQKMELPKLPKLDEKLKKELTEYLLENYRSPEEYIISKFKEHDIVFIGELHYVKHDLELIHNLIPLLYKNGIFNLGMEFACYADQEKIENLITSDEYDEDLAKEIQFRGNHSWGYQEYVDIFKKAWILNKNLPPGARKFRVVGLNSKYEGYVVEKGRGRRIFKEGFSDNVMADVILKEFVDKNEKALVYAGANHTYTEYKQPIYYEEEKRFLRFEEERMGNIVYQRIGKRAITIILHLPWPSSEGWSKPTVYPVDGVIDALMAEMDEQHRRVGFDTKGTPFGKLKGETSLWKHGYEDFKLSDYCDGYIFQKPFSEYEGVTPIPHFINDENLYEARLQVTPEDCNLLMKVVADMPWLLQMLFRYGHP